MIKIVILASGEETNAENIFRLEQRLYELLVFCVQVVKFGLQIGVAEVGKPRLANLPGHRDGAGHEADGINVHELHFLSLQSEMLVRSERLSWAR